MDRLALFQAQPYSLTDGLKMLQDIGIAPAGHKEVFRALPGHPALKQAHHNMAWVPIRRIKRDMPAFVVLWVRDENIFHDKVNVFNADLAHLSDSHSKLDAQKIIIKNVRLCLDGWSENLFFRRVDKSSSAQWHLYFIDKGHRVFALVHALKLKPFIDRMNERAIMVARVRAHMIMALAHRIPEFLKFTKKLIDHLRFNSADKLLIKIVHGEI